MKLKEKIALKPAVRRSTLLVSALLDVHPLEIFYGDYKFNQVDQGKYKVIIGNADFSGCQNADFSCLKYVTGILNLEETFNAKFGVKKVGSIIANNCFGLSFDDLQEVDGDILLSDTVISSIPKLTNINGIVCQNNSKINGKFATDTQELA